MTSSDDAGASLSLDEKISLLSGEGWWHSASVPGVPQLVLSDGPHGVGSAAVGEFPGAGGRSRRRSHFRRRRRSHPAGIGTWRGSRAPGSRRRLAGSA